MRGRYLNGSPCTQLTCCLLREQNNLKTYYYLVGVNYKYVFPPVMEELHRDEEKDDFVSIGVLTYLL